MDRVAYKYPLLNNYQPDSMTVEQLYQIQADKFIEVPLRGDTLKYLEFPETLVLEGLKITIIQGGIVYHLTLSVQTALRRRIEFQGLGLPLKLADKHPMSISFSKALAFVSLGLGNIQDPEWRSILYRGSRYSTKLIYWTVHHGQVLYTQEADWRITKLTNKHKQITTDQVYSFLNYDDIRPYIKARLLPAWIRWSHKPLRVNERLCYKIVLPADKLEKFSQWCALPGIQIQVLNPWLPLIKRGDILLSSHDSKDSLIALLKKYKIPYRSVD